MAAKKQDATPAEAPSFPLQCIMAYAKDLQLQPTAMLCEVEKPMMDRTKAHEPPTLPIILDVSCLSQRLIHFFLINLI